MKPVNPKVSEGASVRRRAKAGGPAPKAYRCGDGAGVVNFCVHEPVGAASGRYSPAKLVELLSAGLPYRELEDLRANLALPMDRMVPMLDMSKATLHRRQAKGWLDRAASDRVVRYARLLGHARRVFENLEAARQWLNTPQFGLGGAVPLQYAETEVGAREVENLLGRIDHGVYS